MRCVWTWKQTYHCDVFVLVPQISIHSLKCAESKFEGVQRYDMPPGVCGPKCTWLVSMTLPLRFRNNHWVTACCAVSLNQKHRDSSAWLIFLPRQKMLGWTTMCGVSGQESVCLGWDVCSACLENPDDRVWCCAVPPGCKPTLRNCMALSTFLQNAISTERCVVWCNVSGLKDRENATYGSSSAHRKLCVREFMARGTSGLKYSFRYIHGSFHLRSNATLGTSYEVWCLASRPEMGNLWYDVFVFLPKNLTYTTLMVSVVRKMKTSGLPNHVSTRCLPKMDFRTSMSCAPSPEWDEKILRTVTMPRLLVPVKGYPKRWYVVRCHWHKGKI